MYHMGHDFKNTGIASSTIHQGWKEWFGKIFTQKTALFIIKWGFILFSGWYLYAHVIRNARFADIIALAHSILQNPASVWLLSFCITLVFVNWGIEALKWQFLIKKLADISFYTSFKAIFSGTTVSLVMPNRVGEYMGRVLFLEHGKRVRGIFATFVGSIAQLVVTLIMGTVGFIYYEKTFHFPFIISFASVVAAILFIGFTLFFYFNIRSLRGMIPARKWARPLRKYLKVYRLYNRPELERIFAYSLLRYFVFSVQFYLLMVFFGIHIPFIEAMLLIFLMYLVQTIYPTAGITELMVRGAATGFIFAGHSSNVTALLAASYGIWLINLLLPAMVGAAVLGLARTQKRFRAA